MSATPEPTAAALAAFISRWQAASGSERANYQLFIGELCALLAVEAPQPARDEAGENAYCFERRVTFRHGDGSQSNGFIDCYRRGAFVLEAKKLKPGGARSFDDALLRARSQAEGYARALPADEGRPPFLVVVDVGNLIELYAEFSRSGATYTPYPDPRSHRIALADLAKPEIRQRLRSLWLDPLALDPAKLSARVTRQIAERLATLAKSLEAAGHGAETVAAFLTRCLFCLFAEDVGLLPKQAFTGLLETLRETPEQFPPLVGELWQAMDQGGFSLALRTMLPRFNGKLFKSPQVLPLNRDQIDLLIEAGHADWTLVEPAIFGTLLERALDPVERHALGAHYTPRAYVERLVLPTVIEPLRQSWSFVQAAALVLANEGKEKDAVAEIRAFHRRLCELRVLDPACGSGNFLYVALEHLKRLEGEVLNQLHEFGHGQAQIETEGFAVDPHQFLGLEINPRAAAIAELVLWIGYLQWHFRTRGAGLPPTPILKDFRNIECRDAVLAWDDIQLVTDARGAPVTRWNGHSTKAHPVTGEQVPDETARVPLERYLNPRPAVWPAADVVVGNPPFIGASSMRQALGDGYVEALRGAWREVPDSADFVMYWWHQAAVLVTAGQLSRFGFITTNSLRQTFNRRVVAAALERGLQLAFAIPDHPWVDSADGAAVRIAMTVGAPGEGNGRLLTVTNEGGTEGDAVHVEFDERNGQIHADLTTGANITSAVVLRANTGLSHEGIKPHGMGFLVSPEEAAALGNPPIIHEYRNGRDLTDRPRGVRIIDAYGLTADQLRSRYPAVFQHLLERVKPERDQNNRASYRDNWWIFGEPRKDLRPALEGLARYIATVKTAKHRVFQFMDAHILPDSKLIAITLENEFSLGVLSSTPHGIWALAAGSRLGVGNDPTYVKSASFEQFPFPAATEIQRARIGKLAEAIDAHRKKVLAAHEDLTLTGLYNALEKLRAGQPLTAKEKTAHDKGLVAVLKSLHDDLDRAVLDAYGWHDHPDEATLLERLVALNAERAREEAAGIVRWLRPEFQAAAAPTAQPAGRGKTAELLPAVTEPAPAPGERRPWPAGLPEQVSAVAGLLATATTPLSLEALATHFSGKGAWKKRLPQLLDTLAALGKARQVEDGRWMG